MKIEDFQGWSFLPVQFHLCQVNSVAFRSRLCNRTFFSPDLLMKISNFAKTPFDLNKILQLFYTQRCYCVRNGIKIILKGSWKQVGTLFFNILIRVRLFYRPCGSGCLCNFIVFGIRWEIWLNVKLGDLIVCWAEILTGNKDEWAGRKRQREGPGGPGWKGSEWHALLPLRCHCTYEHHYPALY